VNDYDEIWWIFGTGSKLLRDAVYCKVSTTVLKPAKSRERECVYGKQIEVTERGELGIEIWVCSWIEFGKWFSFDFIK